MNSYNYSYNVLINRLEAFAAGHFLIKRFTHGQIDMSDQLQDDQYPFMHVTPDTIEPISGGMRFGFHIMFADIPRDKEYKAEYQREVISDCIRLGQDLIAEVKNGLQLFGFDVQLVNDVTFEPFMEEQKNTVTGVAFTIQLEVPWDWSACDIPAIWSVGGTSSGGSGTGYGITLQTNGVDNIVQTLLNLEAGSNITITDNGNGTITIDSTGGGGGGGEFVSTEFNANHTTAQGNQYVIGDRVWYNGSVYRCIANNDGINPTNPTYWTLVAVGYRLRQTPVDWNASSGDYQILNKPTIPTELRDLTDVNIASPAQNDTLLFDAPSNQFINGQLGAVAYSNDYNDLSNLPSIPPAQVNSDWNAVSGVAEILNKPTGLPPTGAAGGDLQGTYPNPTVHRVHGIDLQSGTPSAGDVWLYEGAPAKWQHQPLPAVHVTNDSAVTGSSVKDALNHLNTTKVEANASITGATATKITYDAKGLVTSSTNLAAADMPTGIDAANIGTGVVSNTEFGYLDGVTSSIQTQINNKKDTVTYGQVYATTLTAGSTAYFAITGITAANATESNRQFAVPVSGTIRDFYVKMSGTQSATGTLVITLRKNAISSAVTVTVSNADGASPVKSDISNTIAITAGDLISIQTINNASVASASILSMAFVIERS